MNNIMNLNPGYSWADLVAMYPEFQDHANLNAAIASAVAGL